MRERDSRASGLAVTAAVFATIASLVVAGVIAAFLVLHVTGSPEQAATTFLTDWQTRTYSGMDAVTVNGPPVVAPAVKNPVEPMLPPPVTVQLNDGCVVRATPN